MTDRRSAAALYLLIASLVAAGAGAAQAPAPPTFTRDVAPIVFANCSGCHRPGGSAPFSLLTYDDVKNRAESIAAATASRFMPPWKPEPGFGEFADTRRLTDEQAARIQQWVRNGALEGDPSELPAVPRWAGDWRLGTPDLVLRMPEPYTLRARGDDMYRHFTLPIPVAMRRYVAAWEFRPGNLRVVHHATMQIDPTGESRHRDHQDPQPGYEGLLAHSVRAPDGFFLDWAPGHTPYVAPEGMAFPVEPGSDLVMMLHLRPSGTDEVLQASVGLYFADTPPSRVPVLLRLTRQDLDIPAGEARHVVTDSYTLPVDVDLFTVQPHAHYLARSIEGFATLPDGATTPLIYVRDWDFDWQDVYRYAAPVFLPRGTTVVMRITYDNSPANPRNPHRPPRRVTFGQRSSDEMAELWFQAVPRGDAERAVLTRSLRAKLLVQEISGYEMMLQAEPDNAALHNEVALLHAQAGNRQRMTAHFLEAVRITPESAAAHYNAGTALLAQGLSAEARVHFERALQIDPAYANAHRSLGVVLQASGKLEAAADSLRRAVALAPLDVAAHHNLGVVAQLQGRLDEAAGHYREALRIDGAYADALHGLALVASARGRIEDAIGHYRDALRVRPGWTAVLVELAGALAAAGRIDEAITSAERALALATSAGDERVAAQLRERLSSYRAQAAGSQR